VDTRFVRSFLGAVLSVLGVWDEYFSLGEKEVEGLELKDWLVLVWILVRGRDCVVCAKW
jgi:hypothetical protein